MKKLKELSEDNESINRFFDSEFLKKILGKKDDESIKSLFDDKFIEKILHNKGEDFTTNIFMKMLHESEAFRKRIIEELKKIE